MEIFETKKALREHLIQLTKDLVRFPSHPDEPGKLMELAEFIKGYFREEKVVIKSYVSNGYPSLVISLEETRHPEILLSGHMDVVSSSNRYSALEEGNLLYGSGVLDMKGGVSVMMALMKYFSRASNLPSLAIMLTGDEEVGGRHGTRMLLEREGYRANFAIINEGRRKYEIVIREKGILNLRLVSRGGFIHSAYPWMGKNVLELLMETLLNLKKIFPHPADKWISTASVTVIEAGKEENTIPGQAHAVMNIRLTGGKQWSKAAILKKITKILPPEIEIVRSSYGAMFEVDKRNEYIKLLRKSAEAVLGKKMTYGENHGSSDAEIFMEQGIPLAILGPVGRYHHSPNEVLETESLVTHFEVLKRFIESEDEYRHKTTSGS